MKAVILGGTFNPVHYGHLFIAEEVRSAYGYDTAIFVPANQPVHKDLSPVIPAAHRLEMLRRAVKGCPEFMVVESEIKRGGPSYTIETVVELVEKLGLRDKPGYLIGDDLVEGFPAWKDAERLSRMVDLFVARRTLAGQLSLQYPHHVVSNAVLPISSSEIRRRIFEGRSVRFLVPDGVLDYIKANKLYG
jgi:nicotinate-nucleotide adenylyltransferase